MAFFGEDITHEYLDANDLNVIDPFDDRSWVRMLVILALVIIGWFYCNRSRPVLPPPWPCQVGEAYYDTKDRVLYYCVASDEWREVLP